MDRPAATPREHLSRQDLAMPQPKRARFADSEPAVRMATGANAQQMPTTVAADSEVASESSAETTSQVGGSRQLNSGNTDNNPAVGSSSSSSSSSSSCWSLSGDPNLDVSKLSANSACENERFVEHDD
mmetsp:Transcript_20748/g.40740  ORF Transcript_20748/g.40740 Transcript_20748/m.40740 type:complete len:128 (+) Transcript_20748:94-477(+)